jgi:phosphopantetheinyl transferase
MFYHCRAFEPDQSPGKVMLCLCRLDANDAQHQEFLTEHEHREYAALKSPQRRSEWLGARVALKKVLLDGKLIESPKDCQIEKDRCGCPSILLRRKPDPIWMNCSISHKNGIASVCTSWAPEVRVGIDIEALSERAWRRRQAFMSPDDSLDRLFQERSYYSILWACKEATAKAVGFGMLINFKKMRVVGDEKGGFRVFMNNKELTSGLYFFVDDFVVALCLQKSPFVVRR